MAKSVETTVTMLEMTEEPHASLVALPHGKLAILRAENLPVHYFRYLYKQVGEDYFWVTRNFISDEELSEILHDGQHDVYVLYLDGCPAAFTEIEWQRDEATINFFGVLSDYIGKGLGPYLLQQILKIIWARSPKRVLIETCTLDHPSALPLYQRHGFRPYSQELRELALENTN